MFYELVYFSKEKRLGTSCFENEEQADIININQIVSISQGYWLDLDKDYFTIKMSNKKVYRIFPGSFQNLSKFLKFVTNKEDVKYMQTATRTTRFDADFHEKFWNDLNDEK